MQMHSHPSAKSPYCCIPFQWPQAQDKAFEWWMKKITALQISCKTYEKKKTRYMTDFIFLCEFWRKKYLWLGLELQFISGKHSEFCRHPRSHTVPLVDDILVQNKSIVTGVPQMNQDISKKHHKKLSITIQSSDVEDHHFPQTPQKSIYHQTC